MTGPIHARVCGECLAFRAGLDPRELRDWLRAGATRRLREEPPLATEPQWSETRTVTSRTGAAASPTLESERLAREFFRRSAEGHHERNLPFIHPEAEIAPTHDPSIIASPAGVAAHLQSDMEPRVLDARGDVFTPLDNARIIVEGHVRVTRPGGGFDAHPVVWALVFRDGLLYRGWALRSVNEAEQRLAQYSGTGVRRKADE